jgi:phospholipid transport system substrate-binding protein
MTLATRLSRRHLLVSALVVGVAGTFMPRLTQAQTGGEPAELTQAFYDALLDTMKRGEELGFEGRYQVLEPVLNQTFDVATMCRIAVGPDWTNLSGTKKGEMLQTFDHYMVTTYAARFRSFSGQKFEVGEVKPAGEGRALVETKLLRSNGEPVELNYLFRFNDNVWRVIDIYLAGAISQMAQLRSEFAQSMRQGGADALIASLEAKIIELKQGA